MAAPNVFARVKPQIIRIAEKYNYQADISANQYTQHYEMPDGQFEIVIPYDGEEYFTSHASDDIKKQMPEAWNQDRLNARIGFIGFPNHLATDLEKQLDLSAHNSVIPLDIPVQSKGIIEGRDSLTNDRHICKITQAYVPNWPETTPLQLSVNIFDEEILSELLMGVELASLSEALVKQAVDSVAQQAGFKRSLIFSFNLTLALPGGVGRADDNNPPILERMAIEWPVTTSHRLINLVIRENSKDKNTPIIYDPDRGVIEWGDIPFLVPKEKSQGTNLYTYQTPQMMLVIQQPGELYQQASLEGEIEVKIPRLFSGLQIESFGTDGQRADIKIEAETKLFSKLSISLEDCFERKVFSPYQHLQFEGVILNEMRVNDIKTLLEDQGFEPTYKRLSSGDQGLERYIFVGLKKKELEALRLWILVEGTRSRTTRRKQIPGGQDFTTEVDTGHMTIYMRGELRGNNTNLIHSMNEVHKQLKERFRHVSTID